MTRARDGVVLRHAAHRSARLHAQLHRLRPVGLAAGRVPDLRRRRLRRGRALRRPSLDRAEVRTSCGSTSRRCSRPPAARSGRSATSSRPTASICKPGLVGAVRPDADRARPRRPLAHRRHDARPRRRHRQGGAQRHHHRGGRARLAASRHFADTVPLLRGESMDGFVKGYALLRGRGLDLGPFALRYPEQERTMLRVIADRATSHGRQGLDGLRRHRPAHVRPTGGGGSAASDTRSTATGFRPGAHTGLLLRNQLEFLPAFYGAQVRGGVTRAAQRRQPRPAAAGRDRALRRRGALRARPT